MVVRVSEEGPRGCGYRKKGGIYLVRDGPGHPCDLLPLELHVCSTCGQGIKPARGWTWVNPAEMFKNEKCPKCDPHDFGLPDGPDSSVQIKCRFAFLQRAGLIWVGEQFYKFPEDFAAEAKNVGISRRITCIPRDFVLGETWVLLAHRKVDFRPKEAGRQLSGVKFEMEEEEKEALRPGVFTAFLPERIEKIVGKNVTEEEVAEIEAAGTEPVQVVRLGENQDLFDKEDNHED